MSESESEKDRKRREAVERLRRKDVEKKGKTLPADKAATPPPAKAATPPPAADKPRDDSSRRQALRDRMEQVRGRTAERGAKSETPAKPAQRTRSIPATPTPPDARTTPPVRPTQPAATGKGGRGVVGRGSGVLPPPPARHTVQPTRVAAELSPEVKRDIDNLYSRYSRLEGDAQLGAIYQGIAEIEKLLVEIPLAVDAVRNRGYVHSGRLESQMDSYQAQWESLRPRIESALTDHTTRLNADLSQSSRRVQAISNGNAALIAAAKTAVEGLSSRIDAARRALESLYNNLLNQLRQLNRSVAQVITMMGLLDEAPEIHLRASEGPLVAAEGQWLQNDKDGPEGILFLTDQRLIFEQRQEIVTRRTLGIFKRDSEKIQKVVVEAEVSDVESISHSQEGGFLGIGRAEILQLTFGDRASLSRARFRVKGQEASEWAALLKRVQNGDINRDRHEQYVAEVEAAARLQFPTQCPNCFAAVPTPPRGARSAICEFCNAVINPL
jgi:hypothetical protein